MSTRATANAILIGIVLFCWARPVSAQSVALTMSKGFSPSTVGVGASTTMTVTVTNPNSFTVTGISFSDTYPAGLVPEVVGSYTCGPGSALFTGSGWAFSGVTLGPGASCQVPMSMHATSLGSKVNTTSSVTGTGVPAGSPASATLDVIVVPSDVVTVGTVNAAAGSTVVVPVYVRDTSGTPLGIDQPFGSRIQSYSIKVSYAPASAVQSIAFTRAGITAALTPTFESSPSGPGTISLLDTFSESTNLLPFTSNGALPGNQVAQLSVTLAPGVAVGSSVTLTLDTAVTQLTDAAGTAATKETTGNSSLTTTSGAINVVAPLSMAKAFNPSTVAVGGSQTTTMTVTVTNPNTFAVTGIAFSDTYPAGLVPDVVGAYTCSPGSALFTGSGWAFAGVSLAAGASCQVPMLMHATTIGPIANTTSSVTGTGMPAGTPASATLTVTKANQTITFNTLPDKTFGNAAFDVAPFASASSGLTVAFQSTTTNVCTIANATTMVSIVGVGLCTIAADQGGNGTYNAAPQVPRSFMVAKADQTINFNTLPDKTFGNAAFDVAPFASASSGLTVAFQSTTTNVCTIPNATTTVSIIGAGTCTIAADQTGSGNYNAASQVSRSFTVAAANQTITFGALPDRALAAGSFSISATASSNLTVAFLSTTLSVCTVSNTTVNLLTVGACTIAADQIGNANYNAAPQVTRTFGVNGATGVRMALDTPQTSAVVTAQTPFEIAGWSVDLGAGQGIGVDGVHLWAFPILSGNTFGAGIWLGNAPSFSTRNDIGAAFGSQFTVSGWSVSANPLPAGRYRIAAYPHSTVAPGFPSFQFADVTVVAPAASPFMALDSPRPNEAVGNSLLVSGWAIDAGAPTGTGVDAVHVWAYPIVGGSFGAPTFLGAAMLGLARSDVGAAFGARFSSSGFSLRASGLSPGPYRVVAYARSTVSGVPQATFTDVTVSNGAVAAPWMAIDAPGNGTTKTQPFLITGWALDFGAAVGPGVDAVHVYAARVSDGATTFVGAASYGATRADIGVIFGPTFAGSGYSLSVSGLAPGIYDLTVYVRSTVTGTVNQTLTVRLTIQ